MSYSSYSCRHISAVGLIGSLLIHSPYDSGVQHDRFIIPLDDRVNLRTKRYHTWNEKSTKQIRKKNKPSLHNKINNPPFQTVRRSNCISPATASVLVPNTHYTPGLRSPSKKRPSGNCKLVWPPVFNKGKIRYIYHSTPTHGHKGWMININIDMTESSSLPVFQWKCPQSYWSNNSTAK